MKARMCEAMIFREEDGVLFDSETFVVHELNLSAADILRQIPVGEWVEVGTIATRLQYPEQDVMELVRAAADKGIVYLER
jgi:O6-methylguanine-DNA--protein-cysteine methyltransferase